MHKISKQKFQKIILKTVFIQILLSSISIFFINSILKNTNGSEVSTNIYSLVETAKANNLDPFEYLKKLFEKLPAAESEHDFVDLLPLA